MRQVIHDVLATSQEKCVATVVPCLSTHLLLKTFETWMGHASYFPKSALQHVHMVASVTRHKEGQLALSFIQFGGVMGILVPLYVVCHMCSLSVSFHRNDPIHW